MVLHKHKINKKFPSFQKAGRWMNYVAQGKGVNLLLRNCPLVVLWNWSKYKFSTRKIRIVEIHATKFVHCPLNPLLPHCFHINLIKNDNQTFFPFQIIFLLFWKFNSINCLLNFKELSDNLLRGGKFKYSKYWFIWHTYNWKNTKSKYNFRHSNGNKSL